MAKPRQSRPTTLSPAEFAVFQLGLELYDWQIDALESVGLQQQGEDFSSIVAANGSGKTVYVIAPLVVWFLRRFPKGKVILRSGSFTQVRYQLWPAIRSMSQGLGWKVTAGQSPCTVTTPEGGIALGFSPTDPGKAEGWHPLEGPEVDPVMVIVDEAKTVTEPMFEAFDRCTRRFQLWASSPGPPFGKFYDSHRTQAAQYQSFKVQSSDCPHIDPIKIERDRISYGEKHPIFRSMHLAEFTEDEESLVLPSAALTEAMERAGIVEIPDTSDPAVAATLTAFIDWAAGGDENVIALTDGRVAWVDSAWREKDTVQGVRQAIRRCEQLGLTDGQVWNDVDGLGLPMHQQAREEGWNLREFRGGQAPTDRDHYANRITEAWFDLAKEITTGRLKLAGELALSSDCQQQLSTRKTEWTDKGLLRLESKDKARSRGIKSPDKGDAIAGAWIGHNDHGGAITARSSQGLRSSRSPFATGNHNFTR